MFVCPTGEGEIDKPAAIGIYYTAMSKNINGNTIWLLAILSSLLPISTFGDLILLHEYKLGEPGSIVNDLPQDNVGTAHFANGSFSNTDTAGVTAPGSTVYAAGGLGFNAIVGDVPADNFGMEIWVRMGNTTRESTIVTSGSNNSLRLVQTNGNFTATIGEGINIIGSQPATTDWTNLAIIRHNGLSSFYVNGLAVGGTNATVPVRNSVHVGVRPGGGFTLPPNSGIDELRFFSFDGADDPVSFLNLIPEPTTLGLILFGGCLLRIRNRLPS
jgi:hypothetical protein